MAKVYTLQQRSFRNWQRHGGAARGTRRVAAALGKPGIQLAMWASGNRTQLPMGVAAELSIHTRIPLRRLLTAEQQRTVTRIDLARKEDTTWGELDARGSK